MEPYEILGVRPGAGRPEVTEAYRRFALRHHPDRGGDRAAFEAGVEAYRRLTGDPRGATATPTAPPAPGRAPANVVFHRRRPAVAALLRRALRPRGRDRRPTHRSLS